MLRSSHSKRHRRGNMINNGQGGSMINYRESDDPELISPSGGRSPCGPKSSSNTLALSKSALGITESDRMRLTSLTLMTGNERTEEPENYPAEGMILKPIQLKIPMKST
jgi:hypothetical protein